MFELRVTGLTIPQISRQLRGEGYRAGEKTVWSDLHTDEAKAFIEELLRKQFADITLAGEDLELRLRFRDKLLDKFMPQLIKKKIEGELKVDAGSDVKELLEQYNKLISNIHSDESE